MVICGSHTAEDFSDEVLGNELVKKVAHRVNEDDPGTAPAQRLVEAVVMQPHVVEGVRRSPRGSRVAEAKTDRLRVAMGAAR